MRKIFIDCGAHHGESVHFFHELCLDSDAFEIFCFEANSNFNHFFDNLTVNYINKVVWIEDSVINFYQIDHSHTASLASSILKEKAGPGTRIYEKKMPNKQLIKYYDKKIERTQIRHQRYIERGDNNKQKRARQRLNKLLRKLSDIKAQAQGQGRTIQKKSINLSGWIIDNFEPNDFIILKLDIEGAEYDILEKMLKDNSISYINHLFIDWHYTKTQGKISEERHNTLLRELQNRNIHPREWDAIQKKCDFNA